MFFKKKKTQPVFEAVTAGADRFGGFAFEGSSFVEENLYESLRENVPVVDAAVTKLVRLSGGFKLSCKNKAVEKNIRDFAENVSVGISGTGLAAFADAYLDSLLTYGRAFGEILVCPKTLKISAVRCAECTRYKPLENGGVLDVMKNEPLEIAHPERVFFSALNPSAKRPEGTSLLRGLPALSSVLMQIYKTIGQNFERAGNVRYAVTYKPSNENDSAFAKERATEIAKQWSDGMAATKCGNIKDFVAVGDVAIKVIGSDGVILDTEVPVKQILEQLISKLSIPPFLLGLSWSTTERMSSQQADILTSEIDYYRRLVEQPIRRVISLYKALNGIDDEITVEWDNVNLQDEESLAKARLYNAQAAELEAALDEKNNTNKR